MLKWTDRAIDERIIAETRNGLISWPKSMRIVMIDVRDDTLAEQAQYVADLEACVRAADKVADWFPVWPSRRDMEEYKAARAKITLPDSADSS